MMHCHYCKGIVIVIFGVFPDVTCNCIDWQIHPVVSECIDASRNTSPHCTSPFVFEQFPSNSTLWRFAESAGFSEEVTNKLSNLTDVAKKRHQLEQRVCADEALLGCTMKFHGLLFGTFSIALSFERAKGQCSMFRWDIWSCGVPLLASNDLFKMSVLDPPYIPWGSTRVTFIKRSWEDKVSQYLIHWKPSGRCSILNILNHAVVFL